jgi:hypothetical protein
MQHTSHSRGNGRVQNGYANGRAEAPPLREPPHNIEAEQALIGALAIDKRVIDRVADIVDPEHFFDPLHQAIYKTQCQLIASGQSADPTMLKPFFEKVEQIGGRTGPQYLGWLAANVPTTINARAYAKAIFDTAIRRQLVVMGEDIQSAAYDAPADFLPEEQIAEHLQRLTSLHGVVCRSAGTLEYATSATIDTVRKDVVKDLISAAGAAMVYGESRAGKTFVLTDLGFSIAHGTKFMGRATEQGAVLYVPLEGQGNFRKRLAAAKQRHGDPGKMFAWVKRPGTLNSSLDSASYVAFLIATCKQLAGEADAPVRCVIIDTLARALAGENENDASVMAAAMSHAARITAETGATVLFSHHPGKDKERGPRGSSNLFASCDDVIEIEREDGDSVRSVFVRKAKDGEEGPVGTFTLDRVELGIGADGEPVTSCVVNHRASTPKRKMRRRPKDGTANGKALVELDHLVMKGKGTLSKGHERIPDGLTLINVDDWRAARRKKRLSEGDNDSEERAFRRTKQQLSADGWVGAYDAWVWLIADKSSEPSQGGRNGP